MMRLLYVVSILLVTVCFKTEGQGMYPLHTGNVWQYYELLPTRYSWTDRVIGDTTMPNGLTYKSIIRDFGENQYLRQAGSKIYEYRRKSLNLFEDHILYDFSKTVGDTILAEYHQGDTLVCTIIQDRYAQVFGHWRRVRTYYEQGSPWIFHVLRELTDSIGLTNIEYEASPSYRLTGAILNGRQFGTITGVDVRIPAQPNQYTLLQNYPNPFNSGTKIQISLASRQAVNAAVLDVLGQRVRLLHAGEMESGLHIFSWDATTDEGKRVASGLYFLVLAGNGYSITKKMMLLQ